MEKKFIGSDFLSLLMRQPILLIKWLKVLCILGRTMFTLKGLNLRKERNKVKIFKRQNENSERKWSMH